MFGIVSTSLKHFLCAFVVTCLELQKHHPATTCSTPNHHPKDQSALREDEDPASRSQRAEERGQAGKGFLCVDQKKAQQGSALPQQDLSKAHGPSV